jgi:hypothetical protein
VHQGVYQVGRGAKVWFGMEDTTDCIGRMARFVPMGLDFGGGLAGMGSLGARAAADEELRGGYLQMVIASVSSRNN